MIRIPTNLIIAAVAALAVAPLASAQTFSHTSGTGNVLPSHYDEHGNLVADYMSKNGAVAPNQRGRSAYAADPAKRTPAARRRGRTGHH